MGDEWASGEPGSDFVEVGFVVWFSSVTWMLDSVHAEQVTNVVVVCLLGPSLAFDVKPLVTYVAANCGLFVRHSPTARSTWVLGNMGSRVDFDVKHK